MYLSGSHSPGGAALFCTIDENTVDRCVSRKMLLKHVKYE